MHFPRLSGISQVSDIQQTFSFLETAGVFLLILVFGVTLGLGLFMILALIVRHRVNRMGRLVDYLFDQLGKIYFCSYPLREVYRTEFFRRYRQSVDWGFCSLVAAMSMLALKHNPTARYVYARAGKNRYEHCWTEFCYQNVWYVLDPCWRRPFVLSRRSYYLKVMPKIIKVCDHEEFWSYQISHQCYEKMTCPQTSWLIGELMNTYGIQEGETGQLFHPKIAEKTLKEKDGKHIDLWLLYEYPEIIFSRRIMHDMMQKPSRLRPKAHHMRKVQKAQRLVRQSFEEILAHANDQRGDKLF